MNSNRSTHTISSTGSTRVPRAAHTAAGLPLVSRSRT